MQTSVKCQEDEVHHRPFERSSSTERRPSTRLVGASVPAALVSDAKKTRLHDCLVQRGRCAHECSEPATGTPKRWFLGRLDHDGRAHHLGDRLSSASLALAAASRSGSRLPQPEDGNRRKRWLLLPRRWNATEYSSWMRARSMMLVQNEQRENGPPHSHRWSF